MRCSEDRMRCYLLCLFEIEGEKNATEWNGIFCRKHVCLPSPLSPSLLLHRYELGKSVVYIMCITFRHVHLIILAHLWRPTHACLFTFFHWGHASPRWTEAEKKNSLCLLLDLDSGTMLLNRKDCCAKPGSGHPVTWWTTLRTLSFPTSQSLSFTRKTVTSAGLFASSLDEQLPSRLDCGWRKNHGSRTRHNPETWMASSIVVNPTWPHHINRSF